MPRRKGKIPRITFGPAKPIQLTEETWREIEKAYGSLISQQARTQITRVTTQFLQQASAEKTGLLDDAVQRATELRDRAQALLGTIDDRPIEDVIREYVDEAVALNYAMLKFDQGFSARSYVGYFSLEVSRFVIACETTLREFEEYEQFDFWPDGWAWGGWIRGLARIAASHNLPRRVSKDPNSRRSPFVALVDALQSHLPAEHARAHHSEGALAGAINKALRWSKPPLVRKRAVKGRDANEEGSEEKKTRNSSQKRL